jgi:glycosyltransferase involved in cell wall biosynthesis
VHAEPHSLTVVMPVFNQAQEIGATLRALEDAISATSFVADVVVVDDGSTDGTAAAARAAAGRCALTVIEQENRGRFEARRRGLEAAEGRYCLLLDSRVLLDLNGLLFVEEQLQGGEAREVWNAHVDIETAGNPYGVFWDVLTRRVFSEYFARPRTTSYGLADFERFPKGTTCFFAPRALLVEGFEAWRSRYADRRHANDDTPVIRWLAARRPINISPRFSCRYSARNELGSFLRHAYHRGTVFVDGHGRPESDWFPLVIGLYTVSAGSLVIGRRTPLVLAALGALTSAAGAALAVAEARPKDAVTMAWVTPLYATAHVAGMWRGLGLLIHARLVPPG